MTTLPGALVHQLRTIIRKGFGVTKRQSGPRIELAADENGLRIRAQHDVVALEYCQSGPFDECNFSGPFNMLRDCTAGKNTEVAFQIEESEVAVTWSEAGIPKSLRFPAQTGGEFPKYPEKWQSNSPELLAALRDAMETADSESSRYALNHLRLRGRDGQVAATDGRQLLAHSGFTFPFEETLLVPASAVFACADLHLGLPVEVGALDDWVAMRTGPWTIWLKIDKSSRFPEIDSLLPSREQSATILQLTDADADFLRQSLKHLPGSEDFNSPITVDLNGAVIVRASAPGDLKSTDLILTQSAREGEEVRFAANRQYLARAAQLGFRRFQINKPDAPVAARLGARTYVWANLSKDSVLKPRQNTTRIESPQADSTAATSGPRKHTGSRAVGTSPSPLANGAPLRLKTIIRTLKQSIAGLSEQVSALEKAM